MRSRAAAEELAATMVEIGNGEGRRVRAVVSSMSEPLGHTVGNSLEVAEAISTLKGGGPADLRDLVVTLGAHLMVLARSVATLNDAAAALGKLLDSGIAADHFEKLIEAQGGDPAVVADPARLPHAPHTRIVESESDGWIERVDAGIIAEVALGLGAGRRQKSDPIDPGAGVRLLVRRGEAVRKGQPMAELHCGTRIPLNAAASRLSNAVRITPEQPPVESDELLIIGG